VPTFAPEPAESPSLGERLGTVGVILLAAAAGAVAWVLSSYIKF
jgi:hypothetical protein